MISKLIKTDTNRQRLYVGIVVVGFGWFLYQVSDLLHDHSTWSELAKPAEFAEIVKTLGSALLTIGGAFGIRPPGTQVIPPITVDDSEDSQ